MVAGLKCVPGRRVDQVARPLAGEDIGPLFKRRRDHVQVGVIGNTGVVRANQDVVEFQQRVIHRRRLLLENVEAVTWRFLGENQEWTDEWLGETNELPLMVEITLETEDWGELQWRFKAGIPPTASQIIEGAGQVPVTDPDGLPDGDADATPDVTPPPAATPPPGDPFS